MARTFWVLGCLFGLLGVAAGAFGAHALRARLTPDLLAVFETGARYQMYHALALLGVALAASRWPGGAWRAAGWLFVAGIVIFSGSLYVLALTGTRWLGAITPLGGLAFLAGWLLLALAGWRAAGDADARNGNERPREVTAASAHGYEAAAASPGAKSH